jgi:hypothetical protein
MRNKVVLSVVAAAAIAGCANPNYKPDPLVDACNVGGPMGYQQRVVAYEPNPQAVGGYPVDCRIGRDGVMRLPADKAPR